MVGDNMRYNEKDSEEDKDFKHNIQMEENIDKEALDVIFRLYDKTFKDLVER